MFQFRRFPSIRYGLAYGLSLIHIWYIERTLKEIYQAGIVSTENIQQLQKDSTSSVMVIDDKLANPQATENLSLIHIYDLLLQYHVL